MTHGSMCRPQCNEPEPARSRVCVDVCSTSCLAPTACCRRSKGLPSIERPARFGHLDGTAGQQSKVHARYYEWLAEWIGDAQGIPTIRRGKESAFKPRSVGGPSIYVSVSRSCRRLASGLPLGEGPSWDGEVTSRIRRGQSSRGGDVGNAGTPDSASPGTACRATA